MTSRFAGAAAALALLLATGCSTTVQPPEPVIYVTTNVLGDVVGQVVGEEARVVVLMKPNSDPHSFEISAQEAAGMDEAALVVSNGLGLEEGLQQHLDRVRASGVPTFTAGEHITVLPYTAGDAGGADDPHFWTDPRRMVEVVDALEPTLWEVEGIDRDAVAEGAREYRAELEELDVAMAESFATIPGHRRALVTNHHVFGYLADRYGFRLVGAAIPGGTTLASPSAADLKELADAIREAGVTAIFAESSQPDRLMQVLADESGIHVDVVELHTESLTEPAGGAGTYVEMMRVNTERITSGLSE